MTNDRLSLNSHDPHRVGAPTDIVAAWVDREEFIEGATGESIPWTNEPHFAPARSPWTSGRALAVASTNQTVASPLSADMSSRCAIALDGSATATNSYSLS